jgi:probable blue pigment (indigoidine) exporter
LTIINIPDILTQVDTQRQPNDLEQAHAHCSRPWRTYLALTLAAACWGLGTVVSKRAIEEMPPLTLLPIQLGASLLTLAMLMRQQGPPLRDPSAAPILGRLGILNPGLAYALSLLGLVSISVSLSVMLWAVEPLLILLLAAWFLRERIGPALVALSGVALAGILLVVYEPGSGGTAIGVALTIAGVACRATYTVVTRRWLSTADSTAQVVISQELYAFAFALVLATAVWLLGGDPRLGNVTPAGWASAIGSGVLYYGLAYWLYLSGLRSVPASVAAVSFYLIPAFGVAGGFLLLGERLGTSQWIGVTIVFGAIALILWRTGRSPSGYASEDQAERLGKSPATAP